jgi:DUF4097 and DUF4098 domain-containing protein YvlB
MLRNPIDQSARLAALLIAMTLVPALAGCGYSKWSWSGNRVRTIDRTVVVDNLKSAAVTASIPKDDLIRIRNVAGSIRIVGAEPSDAVNLIADVHARGASPEQTDELLRRMSWTTIQHDERTWWTLDWPLETHHRYHFNYDDRAFEATNENDFARAVTVTTETRSDTPTLFADITITCPPETELRLVNVAGQINGANLIGDYEIRSLVGSVTLDNIDGRFIVDTTRDPVTVRDARGRLTLDTGSGAISVSEAELSKLSADTGSGGVRLARSTADILHADTGSGDVTLRDGGTGEMHVDTGSGVIEIRNMMMGRAVADTGSGTIDVLDSTFHSLSVDTGSGNITVRCDLADAVELVADTGSGNVTIIGGPDAGFDFTADTGSGRVTIGYAVDETRWDNDEIVGARRGDGRTRIHVDTASGSVMLRPR